MDYFSPGLRETVRVVRRVRDRWCLRRAHQALARAETDLGLLGWQQAEFDAPAEAEVNKIKNFEREQGQRQNESANLARALSALQEQREEGRKAYEEQRARMETQRPPLQEALAKAEKEIEIRREQITAGQKRLPEIDREIREANRLYAELLKVEPQTDLVRDEVARVHTRTTALPNEIAEQKTRLARLGVEIDELNKDATDAREEEAALDRDLKQLATEHEDWDRVLQGEVKIKERDKARLEKEIDELEHHKSDPYRHIGQVLADNNIAPMNQPHALEVVRANRTRIQELTQNLALSHDASAREDRTLLRHSLYIWAALIVGVVLVLGALIPW